MLADLEKFGVVGRIYIASEGINGQASCPKVNFPSVQQYFSTHSVEGLQLRPGIDSFNISTDSTKQAFKKLHVRVRRGLVNDGLRTDEYDMSLQPTYLSPEEWHRELSPDQYVDGKQKVLIDMRNIYESEVGYFEGAIMPDVTTFRDGVVAMKDITKELSKDEPVYMYCTGGIRCTKAGAILKSDGFNDVRMLRGGITAYGRWIQQQQQQQQQQQKQQQQQQNIPSDESGSSSRPQVIESIYRGINFTFDKRLGEPIALNQADQLDEQSEDVVSHCHQCGQPSARVTNCRNRTCNALFIQCMTCSAKHQNTCGTPVCIERAAMRLEELKSLRIPTIHPHDRRVRGRSLIKAANSASQ
ncbi:Rhodanese-like protein [Ramicandelaber brevisporus]|nr:Rhodanese-like protein [Ramicandelaber brevisporus]